MPSGPDFIVTHHGSISMVAAQNNDAYHHLVDHVGEDAQFLGDAVAVEPRYLGDVVEALRDAGYEVVMP